MYVTTSLLDPARQITLQALPDGLRQQLPADYLEFVAANGTGTYGGEVVVCYPDTGNIPATFGEVAADLWELDERFTAADLRAATQLGWSTDGDILCVVASRPGEVFVLPRHAEKVSSWPTFRAAVVALAPTTEMPYYDPDFDAALEQISLVQANQRLPIEPIWQAFQQRFKIDRVVRVATQPVCMVSALGGWVAFDLVYKSTITVKYQHAFAEQAAAVLAFLRRQAD